MRRFVLALVIAALPFCGFSQDADDWGFWQSEPEIGDYVGPEDEDAFSEQSDPTPVEIAGDADSGAAEEFSSAPDSPWGFGDLRLGMSMDDVRNVLASDEDFSYRHFTESMLPYTELPVFECKGTHFIERAVFQFYEDRLYSMTVFFNRRKIDFYTLFTTLTSEYGPHSELDPRRIVWDNGASRMTLTKPLTLSFLDAAVHRELLDKSEIRKDSEYMRKQEFLRQFGFGNHSVTPENEDGKTAGISETGEIRSETESADERR